MHLRHLQHFVLAAEERHFHRAAERAGIAQPALSHRIKTMEHDLGVALFERSGRGVTLTDAGRALYERGSRLLDQYDLMVNHVRDVHAGRVGNVRIGFTESASFSPVLTRIFPAFRDAWPEIDLSLSEDHTESLIEAIVLGKIDGAFVRPPIGAGSAIAFEALADEALYAAVPQNHALAGRTSVTLMDLKDESFIIYPRRKAAGLSDAILARCREVGFAPRIIQRTPQLSATVNLVAARMGIAVVPESMLHVRNESVRYLPVDDIGLQAQLGIAYAKGAQTAQLANFLTIVRQARDLDSHAQ